MTDTGYCRKNDSRFRAGDRLGIFRNYRASLVVQGVGYTYNHGRQKFRFTASSMISAAGAAGRHDRQKRNLMSKQWFSEIYDKLQVPVIVCRKDAGMPLVYLNAEAKLLVAPTLSVEEMRGRPLPAALEEVVRFQSREKFMAFESALRDSGSVGEVDINILSYQGDVVPVRLFANAAAFPDGEYFVIYLGKSTRLEVEKGAKDFLNRILNASHRISDVDKAIQHILQLTGDYARVSRAYIFEDIAPTATRNTYEWCARGIEPAIQDLQQLEKASYNYDAIMNSGGMLITSDTRDLPDSDREILEAQGIKSLAILPLYHYDDPLGYIGFDDCERNRKWTREEIQLLRNVASVISSLINRRNAERDSQRRQEIFRTVIDNLDELVYITDMETNELKFVSESLVRALQAPREELLGKPCWEVLRGEAGPCESCPVGALREVDAAGGACSFRPTWEFHSGDTGKWYMVKDSVITWIDGSRVHLGTMMDITYRKQYEDQLKRFASTDAMTDVYNRAWGKDKLSDLFRRDAGERAKKTLCFIDLDGLKRVNDQFGHATGDDMIVNTIRIILSCTRKDDFIIRWGGDEFVLFLNCGPGDAQLVLDKIDFAITHFNSTRQKRYQLSISTGLVDFSDTFDSLDELVDEADRRMYANKVAKKGTRTRVV